MHQFIYLLFIFISNLFILFNINSFSISTYMYMYNLTVMNFFCLFVQFQIFFSLSYYFLYRKCLIIFYIENANSATTSKETPCFSTSMNAEGTKPEVSTNSTIGNVSSATTSIDTPSTSTATNDDEPEQEAYTTSSTRRGGAEESKDDDQCLSPLERFRPGYLWVTDLTRQNWCEQQLYYSFTIPTIAEENPVMTAGTDYHLARGKYTTRKYFNLSAYCRF